MTTTVFSVPAVESIPLPTGSEAQNLRVLHVINGEHFAGAERVQDLLASRLPDCGFEVELAALKPGAFHSARKSTAVLHAVPMRSRFDLRPAWKLARLVQRRQCRLIHSHTPRAALVSSLAARLAGVPLVHHLHGQTATEMNRRLLGRINAAVEVCGMRAADRTIVVSATARRYALELGYDADRTCLVPNGVPAATGFSVSKQAHEGWTIGSVALFRPRKGIETLLQATARLRGKNLPVFLRLIGGFETAAYQQHLRGLAEELGIAPYVQWVGFTANVPAELGRLDAMVLPSLLAEGLPMAVIEAMAAGVPVVASRVDGIVDVIEHERTGLLCQPGDADALARQLARLLLGEVDADQLGELGRQRHKAAFSDQSMAAGVANVYRQVLGLEVQQA
ncbi:MAG: glycosyltransferase [Planctomycetales bacterium]|nr:glycosyltransferase [Planctomycetales bacterium]NIM07687.1 glycosyltransferase [Planctomycetales bacterium]NIN07190.1 glycosyltransferase [Planctomycetales bacterium]NIN76283.1 glycosyltransferase [Planctomycetales bacterium]NIO33489.1 glycosyltransferase [Planctomycetales bacterium]